jgi:hypothetical protein
MITIIKRWNWRFICFSTAKAGSVQRAYNGDRNDFASDTQQSRPLICLFTFATYLFFLNE